jgi:hypothetical protein
MCHLNRVKKRAIFYAYQQKKLLTAQDDALPLCLARYGTFIAFSAVHVTLFKSCSRQQMC